MGQRIASLKNLQALRLYSNKFELEAMAPLGKIKNLKHLSVESTSHEIDFVQPILLNSTSTLRSLVVKTNSTPSGLLQEWEVTVSADDFLAKREHSLTALKSFNLSGVLFDGNFIKSLQRAIDFMGLSELVLGHLSDGRCLFYQQLASLATSSQISSTRINLRILNMEMSYDHYWETLDPGKVNFEAKCRFISAFDTLMTLELKDYNQYPATISTNPGLSDTYLQAIIKHENLRSLNIWYSAINSSRKIPYLSATA